MIQLKGINKNVLNGAPLTRFERYRPRYREGRDGIYHGSVRFREVNPIEYLGDIGYVRHGHLVY